MATGDTKSYFTSSYGWEELSMNDGGEICLGVACPCIVFGKNMSKINEADEQVCCISYWVLSGVSISVPLMGTSWAIAHRILNFPFFLKP